ncbi:MAG: hypothetical protein ACRDN9_10935 [Streptosporangiaceae bacterium]
MGDDPVGRGYVEHLTDADLALLARAGRVAEAPEGLRRRPGRVPGLVARPEVFESLFGDRGSAGFRGVSELVEVSPFLVFAVAVHRASTDLADVSYVPERAEGRAGVPVFDAHQLRTFLEGPGRRLFLAELLASFSRVASGRYWTNTPHGPRPRRYSELDPVRLAGLAEALPEAERPGVYRRLGDVTLFLAGVFPEYTRTHALGLVDAGRLVRVAGIGMDEREELAAAPTIQLFEYLGRRWYRQACDLVAVRSAGLAVVSEVAESFREARRVLNHIADRYLFSAGNSWFTSPGS